MRRKDREVTEHSQLLEILDKYMVCTIALHDEPFPYIVPMNYGYEEKDGEITIYLHCAKEGQKMDLLRKNPAIGFEIDGGHGLIGNEEKFVYSYTYESIIGAGFAKVIEDESEKKEALCAFMKHQTGKTFTEIPQAAFNAVTMIAVSVKKLSGKRNLGKDKKYE